MENIRVACVPCGQRRCVVTWLRRPSPADGQDSPAYWAVPSILYHSVRCAHWPIEEDVQSLTAPREHSYETLACRYADYVVISSLKMQSK